jgi:ferrous iron transport protein B
MLKEADVIVNVVDSTNLERNLYLTHELLETKKPVIVILNLWDEAKHLGIHINEKVLEKILGVPVVPTVALTGEGIKTLVTRLNEAKSPKKYKPISEDKRWIEIGHIIKRIERVEHRHHTLRDKINDLTIKPSTGIPIAIFVVFFTFLIVWLIGESLSKYLIQPVFQHAYKPLIMGFGEWLGPGLPYQILISQTYGEIVFEESLGILTTGFYVPLAIVLPYIIAFYFMLSLLEDSGYLPRLATLVDTIFHKIGMHGFGIIPLFLGIGCNVPGALATRTLETRKQRFIAATLLAIAVPCMAQTAMIFGILGRYGIQYILMVIFTLMILYFVVGVILNRFVKGPSPEIFMEIPPYRRPNFHVTFKKTWMRVRWFLKEAIPFLILGVAFINILYTVGFLQWVGNALSPVMQGLFGLPGETSVAMVVGFLRKDLAVGMLLTVEGIGVYQLVIAATMLTIYFPCIASFIVLLRELGLKDMIKAALIMISTAAIVGIVLRLILLGV